jgi:hypothetical protein
MPISIATGGSAIAQSNNSASHRSSPYPNRQPQFNVRQEADRRLKFLIWLSEYRGADNADCTDLLFVAACAKLASTPRHDLRIALAGFAERAAIAYDDGAAAGICRRACLAMERRSSRWLSAKKAGLYLKVTTEERRAYFEETGVHANVDPSGESAAAKDGRSVAERRERDRDRKRAVRRDNGVRPRGVYRLQARRKHLPPWEALGLSRATYYRRRRAGTLVVAAVSRGTGGAARPPRTTPSISEQAHNPKEISPLERSSTSREVRDLSNSFLAKHGQTESHSEVSALETLANLDALGDRPCLMGRVAR